MNGKQNAWEIKSGATYSSDYLKGIGKWAQLSDTPVKQLHAIYTGNKSIKTSKGNVIAINDSS